MISVSIVFHSFTLKLIGDSGMMLWKEELADKWGTKCPNPADCAGDCHSPQSGSGDFIKNDNKTFL